MRFKLYFNRHSKVTNQIFTPLSVMHANKSRVDSDFCTCTKIMFHGYEISISSDQSLCSNVDLTRTDIRVYQEETDITYRFIEDYNRINKCETNIFTDPDDLLFIMNTILSKKQSVVNKVSEVIDSVAKGRLYIGRRSGAFYEGGSPPPLFAPKKVL